MERKISHKVGVKVFSEAQLENVLPTYRNLFHKIEICRNVAEEELVRRRTGIINIILCMIMFSLY